MFPWVPGRTHNLGTFGMYPICYWQVSGRYLQPEPTMYSRCFYWFPGPLAPSVYISMVHFTCLQQYATKIWTHRSVFPLSCRRIHNWSKTTSLHMTVCDTHCTRSLCCLRIKHHEGDVKAEDEVNVLID